MFSSYIFKVALGSGLIGIATGLVGVFAVARQESLISDALSHASLPGICIAFMIIARKSAPLLLLGAVLSGLLAVFFIVNAVKYTKIKFDSSLALILSSFFGLGMVLLGVIQNSNYKNQAGLDKYIFGQAAAFLKSDLDMIFIINLVVIGLVILFFKELKVFSFDANFSQTIGINPTFMQIILSFLLVLTIMGGLQTVGLILMSSLIICPATAARLLSDKLSVNLIIAVIIGFLSGVLGTLASVKFELPTGPCITIIAVCTVFLGLFFSPKHGIWAEKRRLKKIRKGDLCF